MGEIKTVPEKARLITGVIYNGDVIKDVNRIERKLTEHFGEIDIRSGEVPFNYTDYYNKEMGGNLARYWVSFSKLILPDEISGIKHVTNRLEKELSENSGYNRCVNLDPGYINSARLALVSTKDFSHRIYLKDGIYAEITLLYKNRNFVKLDWTYPDYMSETAIAFFKKARDKC